MKRVICVIVLICLSFTLFGCSKSTDNKPNSKKVIAVNGDSVDYFRMWLPFSKKPVLHDGIGYWAEYYWIYCNDKYIRYSNPLGREWRT